MYAIHTKEHHYGNLSRYEGIKGNVTAEGFADHIKVLSINFGVSRGISMEPVTWLTAKPPALV